MNSLYEIEQAKLLEVFMNTDEQLTKHDLADELIRSGRSSLNEMLPPHNAVRAHMVSLSRQFYTYGLVCFEREYRRDIGLSYYKLTDDAKLFIETFLSHPIWDEDGNPNGIEYIIPKNLRRDEA
jgi:hypothetical protein